MHFGYFMLQVTLSAVVCSATGLNTNSTKFMDQDDDVTTNMTTVQTNERNKTTKTQTLTDRPTPPMTDRPTLPTTDRPILPMTDRPTLPTTDRPILPMTDRPTLPTTDETVTKEQAQEFEPSSTPPSTTTTTNVPGEFWHQRRILRIFFVALPATIILLGSIILILTRSFLTKSCKSQESKDLNEEQTANLASEAVIKGHDGDAKESELPDDKNNVLASLEKITGDESKSDETQIKSDDKDLGKTNGSDMHSDTKQTEDEPLKTDMKLDVLSTLFGVDDKELKPTETATETAKDSSPKDVKQTVTETDQKHPLETKPTEFTKNINNVAVENVESNLQVNGIEGNACKPQSAGNTNQSSDTTKLAERDDKTEHLENDPTASFQKEPVVTNIKDTSDVQIDTKENENQGDLKSPPHQSGPTLESRQELLIAIAELNAEVELLPSFPQAENLASDTAESNVAEKIVPAENLTSDTSESNVTEKDNVWPAENLTSDTPESNVTEKVAPPATSEVVDPPGSADLENLGLPEPPNSIDLNPSQSPESLDLKDEETPKFPEPPPESDDSEDEEDSDN